MKKIILLFGLFILIFMMSACGKTPNPSSNTTENTGNSMESEDSNDSMESEGSEELDGSEKLNTSEELKDSEAGKDSESEVTTEESQADVTIDISKTDLELLASIPLRIPESLIYVTESTSDGGGKTITTTYTKGDFARNEYMNVEDGMTQVSIDNPELGANYMFTVGEDSGLLSKDMDYEDKGTAADPNYEDATYADLFIQEEFPDLKATIEDLDGHQTIHIVSTQSDGDTGSLEINVWYSTEFAIPLRYDMTANGVLMSSSIVTDYQVNATIDDSLFIPPADVTFVEW